MALEDVFAKAGAGNVSAPKARIGGHLDTLGGFTAKTANDLSRRLGSPRHID